MRLIKPPANPEAITRQIPTMLRNCGGDPACVQQQAKEIVGEMKEIEFRHIHYDEISAEPYAFLKGEIPVLVSAPHGAKHFRQDRWKSEDEYTSSLAIVLGRLTGAHVLYTRNKSPEDPNWDEPSVYKALLAGIVQQYGIRFVIDLHGSYMERPYKIDVGIITSNPGKSSCPTYRETLQEVFADFQQPLFNQSFSARGGRTITSFCKRELGIEAAQFEINARYRVLEEKGVAGERPFRASDENVVAMVLRIAQTIQRINEKIKEEDSPLPAREPAGGRLP